MTKKNFFIGGLIFFCLFLLFTFLVKQDLFTHLDFNLLVRVQNHVPKKLDKYLVFFDKLASFWILAPLCLFIVLWRQKKRGIMTFVFFLLGHGIELIMKVISKQAGPPFLFHRYYDNVYFDKAYVIPGSSYPSGHSFRAIFLFILFSYLLWNSKKYTLSAKYVFILFFLFCAVMIIATKAIFGEHWPTDLFGGILLGLSLSSFAFFCNK